MTEVRRKIPEPETGEVKSAPNIAPRLAQYKVIKLAFDPSVATQELEKLEREGFAEIVAVYTLNAPTGEAAFVVLRRT